MRKPTQRRAMLAAAFVLAALSNSCKSSASSEEKPAPPSTVGDAGINAAATQTLPGYECEPQVYSTELDLPEASGATQIENLGLLVVADSGHDGKYVVLSEPDGKVIESGSLPLKKKFHDDIEGVTVDHGGGETRVIAINSAGSLFSFERTKDGFAAGPAYAITPPSPGCTKRVGNCGHNWEGICLGSITRGTLNGCLGAVVSKRDGELVCIIRDSDGRLALDNKRRTRVAKRNTLSGCDIAGGVIWTSTNVLGGNTIHVLESGEPVSISLVMFGSIEAISVTSDSAGTLLTLFSDVNRSPSGAFRYRCKAAL